MIQDYWWLIFVGIALVAVLVLWLVLGRRKGVGTEAAASLRDLDGSQAARPTFTRPDPMSAPPPLATGSSVAQPVPLTPAPDALRTDPGARADEPPAEPVGRTDPPSDRSLADGDAPAPEFEAPRDLPPTGDDLTRMKGLGPKLRDRLAELGVTRFHQIAAWQDADIERIDAELGRFAGRIRRDEWVEQARFLAADDREGYEERFGALG